MHATLTHPVVQAECLTAFAELRKGSDPDGVEIGEGVNHFPPSPDLAQYLSALLDRCIRDGTLSAYASPLHTGTRAATAELLGDHLGLRLDGADIAFTRGGTEAINLITQHLAATEHGLILPLPNYYAFDQSAVRWGAPVTAYYRHDGQCHPTGAPTPALHCLVEVLPNGITSTAHTLPDLPEPDFTLVDVPFQLGTSSLPRILRDRLSQLDLRRAAVILTASKDLSLPGLRAAAIVTRNTALLKHLSRDGFERMAMCGNPLGEIALVLYVSLLRLLDSPEEQTAKLVRTARETAASAGLPDLPSTGAHHRIRAHLRRMAARFQHNAELVTAPGSPLRTLPEAQPGAGYSTMTELRQRQPDFLTWVRECGHAGLVLNPTVVHGGTAEAWQALYPAGQLLRINLSTQSERLAGELGLITHHIHARNPCPGAPHNPAR
ncbi:hypothetical protein T261_0750 [Streptomyces lydicus]|nr:hypothetical protein T261_0750 [Streptomyces lydicus]